MKASSSSHDWYLLGAQRNKKIGVFLLCWLGHVLSLQAQLFFGMNSDIRPYELLSHESEKFEEANLKSSDGDSRRFGIDDQTTTVRLVLFNYRQSMRTLNYFNQKERSRMASDLSTAFTEHRFSESVNSTETVTITGADLPKILYSERWDASLPIPLGESSTLALIGGAGITSDKIDIRNEDYHFHNAVVFGHQLTDGDSWSAGVLQASYLGKIGELIPLGEYTSRFSGGFLSAGITYITVPSETSSDELFEPIAYPFFSLGLNTDLPIQFFINPNRVSFYIRPSESLFVEMKVLLEDEAYRLTQQDPWQSSIVSFAHVRSAAIFGYYFLKWLQIYGGIGGFSDQKMRFFDDDAKEIVVFSSDESLSTILGVSLVY